MDNESIPSPSQPPESSTPTPTADSGPAAHSRRTLLRAAGGIGLLGAAAAVGGATAFGQHSGTSSGTDSASTLRALARQTGMACVDLTPEVTEGPYYLPNELVRQDIREDQAGFPLQLTFRVMNSTTCKPLSQAAVDIWHCSATGVYSGVAQQAEGEQPTDSNTFLRGIQLTDHTGRCTITTILPGWYPGRAVHIHLKVHLGGSVSHRHYTGGRVSHTGQVFFAESLLGKIEDLDPYRQDTADRPSNDGDQIYHQAGGTSAIVDAAAIVKGDPSKGYTGVMMLGIDPSADQ